MVTSALPSYQLLQQCSANRKQEESISLPETRRGRSNAFKKERQTSKVKGPQKGKGSKGSSGGFLSKGKSKGKTKSKGKGQWNGAFSLNFHFRQHVENNGFVVRVGQNKTCIYPARFHDSMKWLAQDIASWGGPGLTALTVLTRRCWNCCCGAHLLVSRICQTTNAISETGAQQCAKFTKLQKPKRPDPGLNPGSRLTPLPAS